MKSSVSAFSPESLVLIVLVGVIAIGLRWFMGKSAWPYHVGGRMGYLRDEAVRLVAILVPAIVIGIGFRIVSINYAQSLSKAIWILPLGVVIAVILARTSGKYFGPVKAATERIVSARQAFYASKQAAQ